MNKKKTALLCVDMRYRTQQEVMVSLIKQKQYFQRLEGKVVPNIARIQAVFREQKMEVIHTKMSH
ncbi:hypothetical protein [Bacillus sp. X1(2014)]|uniref:hypothetical protein n=1 Tax=Bacillus sp. X1(2014) TaxID=1565991 RepID=UPI001C92D475|nr:hypothetical protein [Bacillus sp. X1(2014)]